VYSREVNCDPWSVLKISGWPLLSASSRASRQNPTSIVFDSRHSSRASRQNPTSIVFDSRHDNTYRLYQSITAVRYMNPRFIGTYVISELQASSGRVNVRSQSRYG
jgi:hypothetical protein